MKKSYRKPTLIARAKLAGVTATPCVIVSVTTKTDI